MIFDKTTVIEAVKKTLTATERSQKKKIDFALAVCLDDLSLRLRSDSYLTSYTTTISTGEQTATLTGDNMDLQSIYALVIESGTTKRTLTWKDQRMFLRDLESNSSNITAGIPEYFTQLGSDAGHPTVKFERQLDTSATLTVYYFADMTPNNVSKARAISPIVNGTLAYFYGFSTQKGSAYYANYEKLVTLLRSSDKYNDDPDTKFELSYFDKGVKSIQSTIRTRRR